MYRTKNYLQLNNIGRGSGHAKILIFNNKHCIFMRFSAPGEMRSARDSVNCTEEKIGVAS
jgi:hypothetical protein